jgi:multimeric flavodoxin WrbA
MTQESKVLVLLGSPRKKSNSSILAEEIAKGAESAGAVTETLFIQDMDIKPCKACWGCQAKESKGCVIKDDMQAVFPKLIEAAAWVISSPVHWFNVSTQTKLWLDRCFALPRYGKNPFTKKIAVAMAYGDTDPVTSGCINAIRSFQDSFRYTGSDLCGVVYGSALYAGDIAKQTDLLEAARALGKKLAL